MKLHNLQIDKAHVEVYYRSKSGLPSIADKLREKIIRDTCESAILSVLYPRSSIFLQIHEMENAGGVSNHQHDSLSLFEYEIHFSVISQISFFLIPVDCMCGECFMFSSIE